MRQPNIVLIGMPGAGKSTVGVLLAKTLGLSFMDTDLVIQCREGRTLQEIIESDGIGRFLGVEAEVVSGLDCRATVIATGGSVVYSDSAMRHLKVNSIVIYLRLGYPEVKQRITNMTTRGIAMARGQQLRELYDERIPLYEKYADVTIDSSAVSIETTLEAIIEAIRDR